MKSFPSCFPPHFVEKILPQGLSDLELDVYRVCKNGKINKESFLSTFEETERGIRPKPSNWTQKLECPGTYSVSCNDEKSSAENALKCLVGYHPEAFIMAGTASSDLGPLQRTVDRDTSYRDASHFDWWLFDGSDPSKSFHKE